MKTRRDEVTIREVTLKVNGNNAGLYETTDGEEFWVPWSLVKGDSVDTLEETGDLYIPRWKADELGLEYDD